jgi:soluble lytic murein transglycosylase-like protein
VFAIKSWKLAALAALAAFAAAILAVNVTAAAQPTGSRHTGAPAFAPLERAAKRLRAVAHSGTPRSQASGPSSPQAPVSPESFGVSSATLAAIAQCESGGDPAAVSADGTYRGLYQFDEATWQSVAGTGDPAAASSAEQTMRAAMLYARSGSSPWPLCGQ